MQKEKEAMLEDMRKKQEEMAKVKNDELMKQMQKEMEKAKLEFEEKPDYNYLIDCLQNDIYNK